MQITRKAEYAILALVDLASQPEGEFASSREVAERQEIPVNFIAQIMALLGKAGWIEGVRGAQGGVRLAIDSRTVSVKNVIELVEGPIAINRCLVGEGECDRRSTCPLCGIWARAQHQMVKVLEETTLSDLVRAKRSLHQTGSPDLGSEVCEMTAAAESSAGR